MLFVVQTGFEARTLASVKADRESRTDLCMALHSEDLDTLDDGGARVVDAVKHCLVKYQHQVSINDLDYLPLIESCWRRDNSL